VDILGPLRIMMHRRPYADVAMAFVVWAVTLVTTDRPAGGQLDPVSIAIAALACSVLIGRRRFPVPVLFAAAAAAETYLGYDEGRGGALVLAAPLIALYTVAELSSRRRALAIGILAMLTLAGLHIVLKPSSPFGADNVALAALGGLAVAAGDGSRSRRAYHAEVQQRAARAEADREAEAARRVTEERLRIARDLHDVLGHHLALIHVQAGVVAHVLDAPPEQAVQALAHIRTASKTALGELNDTIGLLRHPDDRAVPVEPTVGLAGVADLLALFRRSGLTITEHIDGSARPIAIAADLTAYRVIQESLTNVCKHAGPTTVSVRLKYRPDLLRIVVDNLAGTHPAYGRGGYGTLARAGDGHGLAGMRERLTALGGRLDTGPRPEGGFRVMATLPLAFRSPATSLDVAFRSAV
jgi:signal transduction histidine kinase